jgi:succinate dehydrogenase / fumarate reductase membrane anchor subunit
MSEHAQIRTPLGRVRGRGAARTGTSAFWLQRVTSAAGVVLTCLAIIIVLTVLGRNQAATAQILGSAPFAIIMLAFIICSVVHMRIGMQVIVEDYVHDDNAKLALLLANTCFCWAVGLVAAYAILKLSFGL